ncbi:MAG TPA: hypothetical protein VIA80_09565 [Hyphomonadaceae bacterium]
MSKTVEWARKLQRQLRNEIRKTEARAGSVRSPAEELGLLRASDRLPVLRKRLSEVEHLIEAVEENAAPESGWPAFLGDPRAPLSGGAHKQH